MIAAAITIAAVAAYLLLGWHLAVRDLPRLWQAARAAHGDPDDRVTGGLSQKHALAEVKACTVLMVLFWPARIPAVSLNSRLASMATDHDPREAERKVAEQADYIRRLERELDIGT